MAAQGSFSELQSSHAVFSDMLSTLRKLDVENEVVSSDKSNVAQPATLKGPTLEEQQDLTRRTGDITIYKYYGDSVGWGILIGIATSCAFNSFGLLFPRKQTHEHDLYASLSGQWYG